MKYHQTLCLVMTIVVHQMVDILQKCIKRSLLLLMLLPFLTFGQSGKKFTLPKDITPSDYAQDFIIVKLKSTDQTTTEKKAEEVVKLIKAKKASKAIQFTKLPKQGTKSKTNINLSNIYKIELASGQNVIEAINIIIAREDVEYAEPYYLIKPFASPNDPGAAITNGAQYYLKNVKAHEAWRIEKGNPQVIVGVLDTGVDYEHADLKDNHHKNLNDPVDKFDNDGDGFADNYLGWDYADNDNNPMADVSAHGTQVTGVIAGTADNNTGIAGIGYNTSYMPVKIFRSRDNMFFGGYEAIIYAAEKGCSVINLSWGAANAYSNYAQEIINYAVLEKDVVIVAAAGNSGTDVYFYPASYENVLSVAASDANDQKASFSTYNDKVDLVAPGVSIYTTTNGNSYSYINGTSLASPIVAGAAALVRSKYPHLTALQVMEKLRISSDDIFHISANKAFEGKLGKGRLNIEKALQDLNLPSVKIASTSYQNKFGAYAFYDDTIRLALGLKNYLDDSKALKFTLTSENKYSVVLDSVIHLGSLKSLETAFNTENPFKIYLKLDLPDSYPLKFKLKIESENYVDYQVFQIISSPSFLTLGNGGLEFTVASNGNLGINNDYNFQGSGLKYQNQKILEQVGIIISSGTDKVLNNVIRNFDWSTRDKDFTSIENIKYYDDSEASFDARSEFQPISGTSNYLGLNINQKVLAWDSEADKKYMIIEYYITNISASDINNLNTGLFANWDINNKEQNGAQWDDSHKLGYVFDKAGNNLFAGISLLTAQNPSYFAIDQQSLNGNTSTFGKDFTKEYKHATLFNGTTHSVAGAIGSGNDVSHTVGASIGTLRKGESIKVAYAFVAGENLTDLQSSVQQAAKQYSSYTLNPPVLLSVNSCLGSSVTLNPKGETFEFYEDLGLKNLISTGSVYTSLPLWESKTIYAVNLDKGFRSDIRQITILMDEVLPDFSMSSDTVVIQPGTSKIVNFTDKSRSANQWSWTFNNGYKSTVKDPKIKFNTPGVYTVLMEVKNKTGCTGSVSKTLVVVFQGAAPIVEDLTICLNESAIIQASNTSNIKVYADRELKKLLYSGSSYITESLKGSATFYVTNTSETIESEVSLVNVNVTTLTPDFNFQADTIDLQSKNKIQLINLSVNTIAQEWYVNGILFSSEFEPVFENTDNKDKELTLNIWNEYNCKASFTRILKFKKSEMPENQSHIVCKGSNFNLQPGAGKVYYFYEDEKLENLLFKGSQFVVENILTSKKLYVTNADQFIESDAAVMSFSIKTVKADFAFTYSPLQVNVNSLIQIENKSIGAISYHWDLGNGEFQENENPFVSYTSAGKYLIKLTISCGTGCTDSIQKEIVVVEDKGDREPVAKVIQLYPNPSYGIITFNLSEIEDENVDVNIKSNTGELVYSSRINKVSGQHQLDLSSLTVGMYHVSMVTSKGNFTERIIISR